jgi:hypothetical protein
LDPSKETARYRKNLSRQKYFFILKIDPFIQRCIGDEGVREGWRLLYLKYLYARKFGLKYIGSDDICALTCEASEVSGIPGVGGMTENWQSTFQMNRFCI